MPPRLPLFSDDEASTFIYLREHMPEFMALLDPTPSQLRTIRAKLDERYDQVAAELKANRVFEAGTTVFDLLWNAQERDIHSLRFLAYIEKTCASLRLLIPEHLMASLRSAVFRMLVTFDRRESRYRSYVGELSVLNALLSAGLHRLVGIEVGLPNGKRADYSVATDSGSVLLEVENIDFDAAKIHSADDLRRFLLGRIEDKLQTKLANIPSGWAMPFCLAPVLWGDMLGLHQFREYFAHPPPYPALVLQPMILAQLADKDSHIPHYRFLTASAAMELISRAKERGDL